MFLKIKSGLAFFFFVPQLLKGPNCYVVNSDTNENKKPTGCKCPVS